MPYRSPLAALAAFLAPLLLYPAYGQPQGPGPAAAQGGQGQGGGDAGTQEGRGLGFGGQGTQGVVGGLAGPRARGPAQPTPRRPDGSVILGSATPNDKGVWQPTSGGAAVLSTDRADIPFQPWTLAVLADRERNQLEPHTRCKPSGIARQFLTPYGAEILDLPDLKRIYIFDIGGPHTYRTIYMDGRTHPQTPTPAFYGHSIGWWEADTLVVDTTGFNEGFWMDRRGTPHTGALHTVERFTRTDSRSMTYELTIDDPGAYTARWKTGLTFTWEAGTELFEYVCQQANYADYLMLGELESVDRTSSIVP
jgi:hypothetical protein